MSDALTLAEDSIDQFENYSLYANGKNNGFYADNSSTGIKINIGYGFNLTDNISGNGQSVRDQLEAAGITFTDAQWKLVVKYATNPTSTSAASLNKLVGVTVTQEQAATLVGNRLTGIVKTLTKHIPNFAKLPALTQAALENVGYDTFALLGPATYGAATKANLVAVAEQLAFNADHDPTDLSSNKGLELRLLADGLMALGVDPVLNGSHTITSISASGATTPNLTKFLTDILTGNTKIGSETAAEYVASWKLPAATQDFQSLATDLDRSLVTRGVYVATNNTVATKKNPNEQTQALTTAINGYNITISTTSLKLIAPASYTGTITGFTPGRTLDLAAVGTATKATLGPGNVLSVQGVKGGPISLQLDKGADYSTDEFRVAADGNGGTNVTIVPIPTTGQQLPPESSLDNPPLQEIIGLEYGVWVPEGDATVTNHGTIVGVQGVGIDISGNGTITNVGQIIGAVGVLIGLVGKILNSGTITGTNGVAAQIDGGGTVTNANGASIDGTSGGVVITGATGKILNSGTIVASAASGIGSELGDGGTLANATASSLIQGGEYGFWSPDGSATVSNLGTLIGSNGDGIAIGGNSTITNQGFASGASGIDIGGVGTLTNSGTITATNGDAVLISDGGKVTNGVAQSITGTSGGVLITSVVGRISNSGSILATAASGIGSELGSGGSLDNASSSATIQGGEYGFWSPDGPATVSNLGTLTGSNGDGIAIGGSATITNHGVVGGASGIDIGGLGSLINSGTIAATNGDAVLISDGGNVTNDVAKSITGTSGGVIVTSVTGSISNSGTIVASAASGIGSELGSGGSLDNASSATIKGGEYGFWSPDGPATVSNLGTLTGSNGDGIAIGGNGSITNQGSIGGASGIDVGGLGSLTNGGTITATNGDAVLISDGGSVTNDVAKSITGTSGGVIITGVTGGISNSGSVLASIAAGIGSELGSGGSLDNASSATIQGGEYGFWSPDGPATVSNLGTLTGSNGDGIAIGGNGSITNQGSIGGASGIDIGGAGTLTNSGTIAATNGDAVLISDGGNVTNDAAQSITGTSGGVIVISVTGSISNSGTIVASAASGIGSELGSGGSLDNASSATIKGGEYGFWSPDGPATVSNLGTLTGSNGDGIAIGGNGSITNQGSIGGASGIDIGGAGTLTNSGTIAATNGDAVLISDGGNVTNDAAQSITGTSGGVIVISVTGSISNSGTIVASAASGIGSELGSGGSLDNASSATIKGGEYGFWSPDGPATVSNLGTLTGSNGDGIAIGGNGSITNQGSIGGASGIDVGGLGSLTNGGTITATNGDAVLISDGGSVTNDVAQSITGTSGGVIVTGKGGTINNSGTIIASAAAGIGAELGNGGSLDATGSSLIEGGEYGVWAPNGSANVTVAGTVEGAIGIDMGGGDSTLTVNGTVIGTGGTAIDLAQGDQLIMGSGATIVGTVIDPDQSNTLDLAAGSNGTLASALVGLGAFQVDAGADWMLAGQATVAAVANDGTLTVAGGAMLDVTGASGLTGDGVVQLDANSVLDLGSAGTGARIAFLGGGDLVLAAAVFPGPQIAGFGAGDTIDLRDLVPDGLQLDYQTSTGLLQIDHAGALVGSLSFAASSLGIGTFQVASDHHGGTLLTRA